MHQRLKMGQGYRARVCIALAGALACLPGAAHAQTNLPMYDAARAIVLGSSYSDTRAAVLAAGWRLDPNQARTGVQRCGPNTAICIRYPEVSACYGEGGRTCSMEFLDAQHNVLMIQIKVDAPAAPAVKDIYMLHRDGAG